MLQTRKSSTSSGSLRSLKPLQNGRRQCQAHYIHLSEQPLKFLSRHALISTTGGSLGLMKRTGFKLWAICRPYDSYSSQFGPSSSHYTNPLFSFSSCTQPTLAPYSMHQVFRIISVCQWSLPEFLYNKRPSSINRRKAGYLATGQGP